MMNLSNKQVSLKRRTDYKARGKQKEEKTAR